MAETILKDKNTLPDLGVHTLWQRGIIRNYLGGKMRELNAEENLLISGGFLASDPAGTPGGNWVMVDTGHSCLWQPAQPGLGQVGGVFIGQYLGYATLAITIYAGISMYDQLTAQLGAIAQQVYNWVQIQTGMVDSDGNPVVP